MKKLIYISLIIILLIIGGLIYFNLRNAPVSSTIGKPSKEENGKVVFAITDAATDLGNVSSIKITVDSIKVHSSTEGWVTVSDKDMTFDLLKLKAQNVAKLLAEAQLKEGTYQQTKMDIKNVTVVDTDGEKTAKIPSNELKISANLKVKAGEISTVKFDFLADRSLHLTGKGKYILTPVVKVETRSNAKVSIKPDKTVEIKGGKINANLKVGMDIKGRIGVNFEVPANTQLEIKAGEINVLKGSGAEIKFGGEQKKEEAGEETKEECQADCKTKCETTVLADCQNQCEANANLACSAKTKVDCLAKCGATLSSATCNAACALGIKTKCLAQLQAACQTDCRAGVYEDCLNKCQAECQ